MILVFWLLLALDRARAWPSELCLDEAGLLPPDVATSGAAVVAIVPARDEGEILPRTLPALLDQDYPQLWIVVVDDGSTDSTARIAEEVARAAGRRERLLVLTAGPKSAGWTGKVHALAQGVAAAPQVSHQQPEWFLFTDADILHRQGSVRSLLALAVEGGPYDLVSVMARLRAESLWERLLVPPFVFFFQLLYPFRRVRQASSRSAAAAGGCILVRRSTLEEAGGLETIRGEIIDDVALARRIKAAGGKLWLGFDAGIRSVRSYGGLGGLWGMVSRSAFVQLRYRYDLLLLALTGLALLVAAPPLLTVTAAFSLIVDGNASVSHTLPRTLIWSLLSWALAAGAVLPAVRHHRVHDVYAWTFPLAGVLYAGMTLTSACRHLTGQGALWKGRRYGVDRAGRSR